LAPDLISEEHKQQLTERFYTQARRCITPPKRVRSCPRAVRQPIDKWPRLIATQSHEGTLDFNVV